MVTLALILTLICLGAGLYYGLKLAHRQGMITFAVWKTISMIIFLVISIMWFLTLLCLFNISTEAAFKSYLFLLVPFILAIGVLWIIEQLRESQFWHDNARSEKGGSARFAGQSTFRKYKMPRPRKGAKYPNVFLGRSSFRYDCFPRNVSTIDDEMLVTIGMPGSGKSVYVIYNAVSSYHGNIFVLDPKQEIFDQTFEIKLQQGYKCRLLSPFRIPNARRDVNAHTVRFNPMDLINLQDPGAMNVVNLIADGCIIPEPREAKFWVQNSTTILEGTLVYAKAKFPANCQNLPCIADCFSDPDTFKMMVEDMANITDCGGIAQQAAGIIMDAGDNELAGYMNTVRQSLKFATHPEMREHLSHSDCSLKELTNTNEKVFFSVALPPDRMKASAQSRWMRILVNIGMNVVQTSPTKPTPATLFIYDEFLQLSKMDSVANSFLTMRGYGAKIWIFVQDLATLTSLYGEAYNSFMGSSTTQLLGINCNATASWASEKLGQFLKKNPNGTSRAMPLMNPAEVSQFLGKKAGNQLVFPADGAPWRIKSVNWYKSLFSYRIGSIFTVIKSFLNGQ